jgi:transposase-like protein
MRLVISDQHAGLVAALGRSFQGVAHQRCRVHFARNLLALVPKSHQDMVATVFRTIFAQPDPTTVAATWGQVRDQLADRFPKIAGLMDDAKTEVLGFSSLPRAHWTKIWSTNPLERLNKEIKRRARVRPSTSRSWSSPPSVDIRSPKSIRAKAGARVRGQTN